VILALAINLENSSVIQLVSLHPVAAFSYGLSQIGKLEDNDIGLTVNTIGFSESRSGYSFQDTLNILCIDILLWSAITWYFQG